MQEKTEFCGIIELHKANARKEILVATKERQKQFQMLEESKQQHMRSMLFFSMKNLSPKERGDRVRTCRAKIMFALPIEADIINVLLLNEILLICRNSTFTIGFCNKQNEYEEQPILNDNVMHCIQTYHLDGYIEKEEHQHLINRTLATLESQSLIQRGYEIYSKADRDSVLVNGIQVHPRTTDEEDFIVQEEIIFNRRVILIKNAVDNNDAHALVRVVFDSQIPNKPEVNVVPLVKEAIRYCIEMERRFLLLPIVSQFQTTLKPLNTDDHNQTIATLANNIGCNLRGFQLIQPLFNHIKQLWLAEDIVKENYPLNPECVDYMHNTMETLQLLVMNFLIEILEPVISDRVDVAIQSFAAKSLASINILLKSTLLMEVKGPCGQLSSFFGSLEKASIEKCAVSVCSLRYFSPPDDGLSETSVRNDSMTSPSSFLGSNTL